MTTTDTDALTERLARAMHAGEVAGGFAADEWDGMSADSLAWYRANAAAVLPIVAVEVRKAKAEAWDEAASHAESKSWLTNFRADDLRTANPYRETGDQ